MDRTSIIKWISIGLGATFLIALFIFNSNNRPISPHLAGEPWNKNMVLGADDAPNKMVEYSDYFCEFCSYFNEQASSSEFTTKYIDSGLVNLETRIITVLKTLSPNTEQGAESAFCAADQKKFVKYSNHLVPRIKQDFFDKNIGTKSSGKPIDKLPISYFEESAKAVDIDTNKFSDCISQQLHKDEIADNTNKALSLGVTGLPTIVINSYVTSGFDNGWRGFEMMLRAGGVNLK